MVCGALFGFVVALASLVIVTLFEPFKAGVVEVRVAFTVLPLIGATISLLGWRRQRRTAAEAGTVETLDRDEPHSIPRRRRMEVALGLIALVSVMAAGGGLLSHVLKSAMARIDRTGPSPTTVVQDAPGRPDVRLAVAGDTGAGTTHQWRTARTMFLQSETRHYDALLLLGDLVYPSGDASLVRRVVTGRFSSILTPGTELVPVQEAPSTELRRPIEAGEWVVDLRNRMALGSRSDPVRDPHAEPPGSADARTGLVAAGAGRRTQVSPRRNSTCTRHSPLRNRPH